MESGIRILQLLAMLMALLDLNRAMQFPQLRFAPRIEFLPEFMPADEPVDPWEDIRQNCHKKCPFGLVTDVEGRPMCKCSDPCASVRCMDGFQCVPNKTTECVEGFCRYEATCRDINVCDLPRPKPSDSDICDGKVRRYYYDAKRRRCRKFVGCPAMFGNNFGRRKDCKRECIKKPLRKALKKAISGSSKTAVIDRETTQRLVQGKNRFNIGNLLPRKFLCPLDATYAMCNRIYPCSRCKNPKVKCIPDFCGQCPIFIHKETGHITNTCPLA